MSLRIDKINELIRHTVAEIIAKEVSFKNEVIVTIVKANTSPNLKNSRILVSVFPIKESRYVIKTLKHEIYSLQNSLNQKLHMRPLPRIHFFIDETQEAAQKVEDILRNLE